MCCERSLHARRLYTSGSLPGRRRTAGSMRKACCLTQAGAVPNTLQPRSDCMACYAKDQQLAGEHPLHGGWSKDAGSHWPARQSAASRGYVLTLRRSVGQFSRPDGCMSQNSGSCRVTGHPRTCTCGSERWRDLEVKIAVQQRLCTTTARQGDSLGNFMVPGHTRNP